MTEPDRSAIAAALPESCESCRRSVRPSIAPPASQGGPDAPPVNWPAVVLFGPLGFPIGAALLAVALGLLLPLDRVAAELAGVLAAELLPAALARVSEGDLAILVLSVLDRRLLVV